MVREALNAPPAVRSVTPSEETTGDALIGLAFNTNG
jgi:hypothetical protein